MATFREQLARLSPAQVARLLAGLTPEQLEAVAHDWQLWGRPEQQIPLGDWRTWLLLTGRGWGKTRTCSEAVKVWARDPDARIALVAKTAADARDTLVEGPAGIMSVFAPSERPTYLPSVRRLIFKSGAIATTFTSDAPDQLRGPSHTHAVADEIAAWEKPEEVWSNLQLTLRVGAHPRVIAATTPRPIKLLKDLLVSPTTVVTKGRTADNRANLAASALTAFYAQWSGTRLGRQELDGELLEDVEGALWSRELLDRTRVRSAPELARIVVGIDPSVSSGATADECGIIVAGQGTDGDLYVLADLSGRMSPDAWARTAVRAYRAHEASRIVAEVNNGGQLVEDVLRTVDRNVPIRKVHAAHAKIARAEPIAARWEQGRAHIVGELRALEDEMASFTGAPGQASPNRLDAAVWALSLLGGTTSGLERLRALAS